MGKDSPCMVRGEPWGQRFESSPGYASFVFNPAFIYQNTAQYGWTLRKEIEESDQKSQCDNE